MNTKIYNAIILEGELYELKRTENDDVCGTCALQNKCRTLDAIQGFCYNFDAPFDSNFRR